VKGRDVDWIDAELIARAALSDDRKAALWLFAFPLSDPDTRLRRAPSHPRRAAAHDRDLQPQLSQA
jgi:hypothetical protein